MATARSSVHHGASMSARIVGRYALHREIAAGGMATIHLGRLLGPVGFSRIVAVKCLHPQFARDPDLVAMFVDEARLAARIRHPNVVPTLDVVTANGEIFLVMEYVQGESLASLLRLTRARREPIPLRIAGAILVGCLHGLHAAHEATDERGAPLEIVHRDVSPQNLLVGVDGIPRILDFGIARAAGRVATTREGHLKGKLSYMAPEQLHGEPATRRSDVFGAAIVLWETLTGERLFHADFEGAVMERVLFGEIASVRKHRADVPDAVEAIVARGLAQKAQDRFASAQEMAVALAQALDVASTMEVASWVASTAADALAARAALVTEVESTPLSAVAEIVDDAPARVVTAPAPEVHEPTRMTAVTATRSRWPRVVALGSAGVLLAAGALAALRARPLPVGPASPPSAVPVSLPPTTMTIPSVTATAATASVAPPPRPTHPVTRPARPGRTPLDGLPSDRE